MTTKELRALDAHVAEHVMGWPRSHTNHIPVGSFIVMPDGEVFSNRAGMHFSPTTDPAAAMEVLKKCLDRTDMGNPFISKCGTNYWIRTVRDHHHIDGEAPTLETAICLFAQKLYSKSAKSK